MEDPPQESVEVVGPTGGDEAGPDGIFEDEVPADDPGEQLAEGRVSIGIRTAGHRNHAGQLRIAERRESAADRGQQEREDRATARRIPWRRRRSGRRAPNRSSHQCRGPSGPLARAADATARRGSSHRSTVRHLCGGTSWTKTIPSGSSSGDRIEVGSRGIRGPGPDGRGRNGDAGSFRTHQRRAIEPNASTAYDNRTSAVKGLDPTSSVTPSGEWTLPSPSRRRLQSRRTCLLPQQARGTDAHGTRSGWQILHSPRFARCLSRFRDAGDGLGRCRRTGRARR